MEKTVAMWNGPLPTSVWTQTALDFVSHVSKNPPLSSRNYALVHVAMYDAVVASWHWKYAYKVAPPEDVDTLIPAGPDPSYPSEHAAMAGAASRVLAALYPNESALRLDEMAEEAATSRVQAGFNTPSDVAAGLALGRSVAERVIAYAKTDGADTKWDGKRPAGIGGGPEFWEPPPGAVSPPIEPAAGSWKPWVMTSGSQFRPGPPPAFGSPEFRAAAQEIVDLKRNLTAEQKKIAKFWEGAEGTSLPAGIVIGEAEKDIEAAKLSVPRVARALALLSIAMADGGIAAWDAKYIYWNPRPENAIRDLGLDPDWKPYLPTPRFPAYPSGSAGYAGGAETILTYLFPDKAEVFRERADDQTMSRLYAGIHWRYDAVSREAGRKIAELVIERAEKDGSGRSSVNETSHSSTPSTSTTRAPSAAPRWETQASFDGQAPTTTESFTIVPTAIQWRVRWSCEGGGTITITGAPSLKKPLVTESNCPKEGVAYAIQSGPRRLKVEATGPWRVTVDQQVDTPIEEPALRDMAAARVLASGDFYDLEKKGKGTARLYELPNGSRALRFEGFEVTQNTDLFIWLSEAPAPRTSAEVVATPYVQIAVLRSTLGSQNYVVPPEIPTDKIRSVVIWCEPVRVAYAAAALRGG